MRELKTRKKKKVMVVLKNKVLLELLSLAKILIIFYKVLIIVPVCFQPVGRNQFLLIDLKSLSGFSRQFYYCIFKNINTHDPNLNH